MSIVQVAKEAGVSIATVSRVINNNPTVTPEIADAVRRAMDKLGYTPPPAAKRRGRDAKPPFLPVGARRGTVALLFPDSRDAAMRTALSGRLMLGITDALMSKSMHMIATPLAEGGSLPRCIQDRQVDGVLVRGATDLDFLFATLKDHVCVWLLELTRTPPHGDQVFEDNTAVGDLAVRYLMERGHCRLAVLNHDALHPAYAARTRAFVEIARREGAMVDVYEGSDPEQLAARLAASKSRPDGLFVPLADAQLAMVYRELASKGVQPVRDLSLVACANDPATLLALDPSLPNIDVQPEVIARAGAEMLLWRLAHPREPQRRLMIAPELRRGVDGR